MKLTDRISWLRARVISDSFRRGTLNSFPRVVNNERGNTMQRKSQHPMIPVFFFLCKSRFCSLREMLKGLEAGDLEIPSLFLPYTGVDLSVCVVSGVLSHCNACYRRMRRYRKALNRIWAIVTEFKQNLKNDSQLLIKRLTKDPGQATEAHQRYMTDMYEQMNHFYPLAIYFLFPFNLLARDIERPSNLKKIFGRRHLSS